MSEYFVGRTGDGAPDGDPLEPPIPGMPPEEDGGQPGASGPHAVTAPEHVRFGIPFNDVVPVWFDGADIAWYRPLDGTDMREVLGLGLVETEAGPAQAPEPWGEVVETGTIQPGDEGADGPVLRLRAITPSGRRAINDPGDGARIPLSAPLALEEAMGADVADFDITGFSVHIARLLLRAARDGAILLFTLRAPRDPEPHHLLSVPSSVDSRAVMHFHLGTLLEMEGGEWDRATHADGMALLDLDIPYEGLLTGAGPESERGLDVERLVEMAQPVVDCLLKPGFPFALGCSFIVRQ